MKLGDLVLTTGSSSSSSSSTSNSGVGFGVLSLNFTCEIDLDYIYDIIQSSDGNYVAACTAGYAYPVLIKFNEDRIIWAKAFRIKHEGPNAEGGFVSEIDGYFYATYKFWTDIETYSSSMIFKIDQDGNEVWHRNAYSCWADDYPRGVIEALDGTSVIWFYSYYDGGGDFSGGYTPIFYKLDKETGNTIWVKGLENRGYGVYIQLTPTADNNYLISHSLSLNENIEYLYNADVNYQPRLVKITSSGDKIWAKHYYRKNLYITDIITSAKLTADNGFIFLIDAVSTDMPHGWYNWTDYDTLVLKVDSSGIPQWCTRIKNTGAQGNHFEDTPCKIHVLSDGYVFICYDVAGEGNYSLIKLSLTGSFVWGKTIRGDLLPEIATGLWDASVSATDNGFVVYGITTALLSQNSIITFSTDIDGNIDGCPYIEDGITNEIQEGYVTEIVYETAYIKMIDGTYLWTFNQPTATVDFDLEHHVLCPS